MELLFPLSNQAPNTLLHKRWSLKIRISCQILLPHMAEGLLPPRTAAKLWFNLTWSTCCPEGVSSEVFRPPSLPSCRPIRFGSWRAAQPPCFSGIPEGSPSSGWSVCHMAPRHLRLSRFLLRGEMVPILQCFPSLGLL